MHVGKATTKSLNLESREISQFTLLYYTTEQDHYSLMHVFATSSYWNAFVWSSTLLSNLLLVVAMEGL